MRENKSTQWSKFTFFLHFLLYDLKKKKKKNTGIIKAWPLYIKEIKKKKICIIKLVYKAPTKCESHKIIIITDRVYCKCDRKHVCTVSFPLKIILIEVI